MSGRVRVAALGDVPDGQGRVVEAAGRLLALFKVGGTIHVIDNRCPHRGGPLGEGELDGPVVTCPWHAWRWNVVTGASVNNPAVTVARLPVTVEDGTVFVDLG